MRALHRFSTWCSSMSFSPTGDRFAAFRHSSYTRFFFARFLLSFSQQIVSVAVGWQMYDQTGSAIYLGLIGLWQTIEDTSRAARAASIMTLVGFINIPIVKFSVDWWNTLHQPASVFRIEGSAIAGPMLWPLLVMSLAYTLLFATLHVMAIRNEIMRRRTQRLAIMLASVSESAGARMQSVEAVS